MNKYESINLLILYVYMLWQKLTKHQSYSLSSSTFPDEKTIFFFFFRVFLFGAVLTFLFFVLSGCCAVLRSVPLSTLCPAVLTLGALGMSVWRCERTERAGLVVLAGAQYISRRRSSQLWKQHSSTMPRDRRALGP